MGEAVAIVGAAMRPAAAQKRRERRTCFNVRLVRRHDGEDMATIREEEFDVRVACAVQG